MYLKTEEINGYVLTERLRKARRRHHLSAPCQALYYELIAICNEESWEDVFKCSNDELTKALNVTEKSLINYRLELIQAGLIGYKSGKTKKSISDYSFKKVINGCKIYSQSDSPKDSQSDSQSDSPLGQKPSDINKLKKKTKKEIKLNNSLPPVAVEEKTLYWKKLVDVWFIFYKKNFSIEPTFNGQAQKSLKEIVGLIQRAITKSGKEYSESYATSCLEQFFALAYTDDWLRSNFLLTNLYSKFDSIIQKRNVNGNNKATATGANVSTSSILSKIDAMPD